MRIIFSQSRCLGDISWILAVETPGTGSPSCDLERLLWPSGVGCVEIAKTFVSVDGLWRIMAPKVPFEA